MKKIFLSLLITLALAAAGIYFASGPLLEFLTQKGIGLFAVYAGRYGLEIKDPQFKAVRLDSYNAVSWKDILITVKTNGEDAVNIDRRFSLAAGRMTARIQALKSPLLALEVKEGKVYFDPFEETSIKASKEFREFLNVLALEMRFPFKSDPASIARDFSTLLTEGKSRYLNKFAGVSTFSIDGKEFKPAILVRKEGEDSWLVMDRSDLELISSEMQEKLTEAEVDLLSLHPVRAPRLLKIRDYAQTISKAENKKDPQVPEDAYRHVLWSYLLTKAYGEAFAKQVTDAHEIGNVEGETTKDQSMDYNNNAVGRRYALGGIPEADVLGGVVKDPEVVRFAAGA